MSEVIISGGGDFDAKEAVLQAARKAMPLALATVEGAWRARLVPNVRGYRTGTYSRSITNDGGKRVGDVVTGSVGTNLFYAKYLEFGTGLYGPRNRWIVPTTKKFLRFPAAVGKGTGFTLAGRRRSGRAGAMAQFVFAKRVRGIRPRRYAHDAALISQGAVTRIFAAAAREGGRRA